jgi:trehalose-6-phosphatase
MLQDALELVEVVRAARAAAGHLLLGLDFDGTLAPIVPLPEDAALPPPRGRCWSASPPDRTRGSPS